MGLYLHIPFCRSKCDYCDFYSLAGQEDRMGDYQQAKEEIAVVEKLEGYETISREVAIQEAILYSGQKNLPAAVRALEKALERRERTWTSSAGTC